MPFLQFSHILPSIMIIKIQWLVTDNRERNLEVWVKWQSCHGCLKNYTSERRREKIFEGKKCWQHWCSCPHVRQGLTKRKSCPKLCLLVSANSTIFFIKFFFSFPLLTITTVAALINLRHNPEKYYNSHYKCWSAEWIRELCTWDSTSNLNN